MNHLVLVLNCGSSSIKFALYDSTAEGVPRQKIWGGKVNGITSGKATFDASDCARMSLPLSADKPYNDALEYIHQQVLLKQGDRRISAVVHRVVHGGSKYFEPTVLTPEIVANLHSYIPLAPLHQPFALEAIAALLEMYPRMPQVACFDTGFHHTLPVVEKILPLNWAAWERGLCRYGFHGLSYDYLSRALPERHGELASGKVVAAHIGSGASLCAMQNLQSVATTLGFSALDGLMMGSRCGALDPGAVLYLMEIEKLPLEDSNEQVRIALQLYVRRMSKEIAAMATAMNGIDMLVFTAGVGENNPVIRQRVCEELAWLGARLDPVANQQNATIISAPDSAFTIAIEPTNEEWVAAQHTWELIGLGWR